VPRYSTVVHRPLAKFFRDRGTHLAAMIAYFALLSFVPLTFLALSLLGFAGRADDLPFVVEHDGGFDLGRDLGQIGERLLGIHRASV